MNERVSIIDIKKQIPVHCFQSNVLLSFWFVLRSFALVSLLAFLLYVSAQYTNSCIPVLLYAYLQGTVFWGVFTIGHDCGHGSFSQYPVINWIVGNVLHSFILTPYEAWRQSHKSHHNYTCNTEKDEIFYPNPPVKHAAMMITLGGAWFFYLLFSNVPGRRSCHSHFTHTLILSFTSTVTVMLAVTAAIQKWGAYTVISFYGAPLFVFASWLVIVTFLHHNDETCPWFSNRKWTKLRGSLSAVDRDYGWLVNNISHNIQLHQIHHLFPMIPHYHLHDATQALAASFPHLYRIRKTSNVVAFIRGAHKWIRSAFIRT